MKYLQSQKKKINKRKLTVERSRRKLSKFTSFATYFLVILIIGLGGYVIFVKENTFAIKYLEITGTKSFVNSTDLYEIAKGRSLGNNLITFGTRDLKDSLLENFQGAKDIHISKRYPKTLKLNVIERIPLAVIHDKKRASFYLVDEEGYVLGLVGQGTTNFPEIIYTGDIEVGYFLDEEVVSIYFDLLSAIDDEKLMASSMSIHSDYMQMYVEATIEVLIGKEKNISEAVSSLSDLLRQLATEGKDVKRVDLRYDKVIVSYR